jgi:uncharacterized protein YndB with AHSA1/START domain
MEKKLVARASITVKASSARVWAALITPALIKKYFFGSDIVTDWRVGSPILYRGEWQGRAYEDKGRILKFEPEKLLATTHWSPLSGVPDTPENYHTVTYEIVPQGEATKVLLTQDNNASEEEKSHSEQNWKAVLDGLKKLLEG